MNTITQIGRVLLNHLTLFLVILVSPTAFSQTIPKDVSNADKPEVDVEEKLVFWHIKAVRPEAVLLNVKAIDKKGNHHDVKAIQDSEDTNVLSVKAFVNGKKLPVKLIVKEGDQHYPVKAIDDDGTIIDIKAIGENGEILAVKGVSKTGNIVHIRAIDKHLRFYNILALSPHDGINHVKGIKMMDREVETVIHGVKVFAHVKSIQQF